MMDRRSAVWAVVIPLGWLWLSNPEGRFWPAAAPMKLIGAFPVQISDPVAFDWSDLGKPGRYTAFWVESARLRPECDFSALEWRQGKRGGRSDPVTVLLGPSILRPNKKFVAGPWIAQVSVTDFQNTYADVLHSCRWFADKNGTGGIRAFWLTRSRFLN